MADFLAEMERDGLVPDGAVDGSGALVRCPVRDDKPGRRSGWYVFFHDPDVSVGVYGSWKGLPGQGADRRTWSSKSAQRLSAAERAAVDRRVRAARAQQRQAAEAAQAETAARARRLWQAAPPATVDHPYLIAKDIAPHGARMQGERLLIPLYDIGGTIVNLQTIGPGGEKRFLSGGRKKGCFHVIGPRLADVAGKANGQANTETAYLCEGFATGASIHAATGAPVIVAFDAGNLLPVGAAVRDRYPDLAMVVCGDDDVWRPDTGNAGRAAASAAAEALDTRAVFPVFSDTGERPTDFNDMAAIDGPGAVRARLTGGPRVYDTSRRAEYQAMPAHLLDPPGVLGDIARYYNRTARAPQPGFAVQTALALASVVLGRRFKTSKENYTSLYFLNVAKSGTGKEHAKTVIERILEDTGEDGLINGGGYTSSGAVFSTLLRKPRHITVIDEFGRYMEAAAANGNSNYQEANTQLMEAIGRCHGAMRPLAYSTMTLSKEKAAEIADRVIRRPAITMLAMTTPASLYKNLNASHVADGFLGRFIIHRSHMPRAVHDDRDVIGVPGTVADWIATVRARADRDPEFAGTAPAARVLRFDPRAMAAVRAFDHERVRLCDSLEAIGLDALPGRSKEFAMRLALIAALAADPHAQIVGAAAAQWAIDYVRFAMEQTVGMMKMAVSGSEYETQKKEILAALRDRGADGITWKEAQKTPPFSKHKRRDLSDILTALVDAELAAKTVVRSGHRGRPREAWVAVAD